MIFVHTLPLLEFFCYKEYALNQVGSKNKKQKERWCFKNFYAVQKTNKLQENKVAFRAPALLIQQLREIFETSFAVAVIDSSKVLINNPNMMQSLAIYGHQFFRMKFVLTFLIN